MRSPGVGLDTGRLCFLDASREKGVKIARLVGFLVDALNMARKVIRAFGAHCLLLATLGPSEGQARSSAPPPKADVQRGITIAFPLSGEQRTCCVKAANSRF